MSELEREKKETKNVDKGKKKRMKESHIERQKEINGAKRKK